MQACRVVAHGGKEISHGGGDGGHASTKIDGMVEVTKAQANRDVVQAGRDATHAGKEIVPNRDVLHDDWIVGHGSIHVAQGGRQFEQEGTKVALRKVVDRKRMAL